MAIFQFRRNATHCDRTLFLAFADLYSPVLLGNSFIDPVFDGHSESIIAGGSAIAVFGVFLSVIIATEA